VAQKQETKHGSNCATAQPSKSRRAFCVNCTE
jgi:hypothetical protein